MHFFIKMGFEKIINYFVRRRERKELLSSLEGYVHEIKGYENSSSINGLEDKCDMYQLANEVVKNIPFTSRWSGFHRKFGRICGEYIFHIEKLFRGAVPNLKSYLELEAKYTK